MQNANSENDEKTIFKKQSLISLTRQILDLEQSLIESGGEISPELESQLTITEQNLPQKVDDYAAVLSRLDATEAWIKSQTDALKDAQKRVDRAREVLNFRLGQAMALLGKSELEGNHAVFVMKESRGKVEVPDVNALDPIWTKSEFVVTADKIAIGKAIREGQVVTGASIVKEKVIKREVKV